MNVKRYGIWIIIMILLAIGSYFIWFDTSVVYSEPLTKKLLLSVTLLVVCLIFLLCSDVVSWLFRRMVSWKFFHTYAPVYGENLFPNAPINNPAHHDAIDRSTKNLRLYLHQCSGYFWQRKLRIFLVTGNAADVEQLTPGLSSQLWQEDHGVVLLWVGEPGEVANKEWFHEISKLRSRPPDGIVWVTSALYRPYFLEKSQDNRSLTADDLDKLIHHIHDCYGVYGWRLPLFVWSLHTGSQTCAKQYSCPVGCLFPAAPEPQVLSAQLKQMAEKWLSSAIQQGCAEPRNSFLLCLAEQLIQQPASVAEPLSAFLRLPKPLPLAGIFFSPPPEGAARSVIHHWSCDDHWDALCCAVEKLPPALAPCRTGINRGRVLTVSLASVLLLAGAGMLVSFTVNRALLQRVGEMSDRMTNRSETTGTRLIVQSEIQEILELLQYRSQYGAPWYARFGLNQNNRLLSALWPRYENSALPLIRDAAAAHLHQQLLQVVQSVPGGEQREALTRSAYDKLKLYLMLAEPGEMDTTWFSENLLKNWPARENVEDAVWQGNGAYLLQFYAASFQHYADWRIIPDETVVSAVRTLLIQQMAKRYSVSALYKKMLETASQQYADMRLADMTGDTDYSLLFSSSKTVPGVFTRKAWEETVKPAISKISKVRHQETDWVLGDKQVASLQTSVQKTRQELTQRYFADFATNWLNFLNSLKYKKPGNLADTTEQLALMTDTRQSPLIALMNTLDEQGHTGQTRAEASDSLLTFTKNLQDNKTVQPERQQNHAAEQEPLDDTFGPLLALLKKDPGSTGDGELTLRTYLTRVTQVRLRLQQAASASNPQAMMQVLAQTVFQGKSGDLSETQDYGNLVAASLGQPLNGFAQTVFVQPLALSWQKVLRPASASLNAQWQSAIVDDWNRDFATRYPFNDSVSEVSLPLLAQYINSENGRITRFLRTNLNGVLHQEGSRWVKNIMNSQGLTFNPDFLAAVNKLSYLADTVFTGSDSRLHFELRAGTAVNVTQTDLVIDGQSLSYFNQRPFWKSVTWPADTESPGAALSWLSNNTGTQQYADIPGIWGWIRLLDRAKVEPYTGLSHSFSLIWKTPDGKSLNYILRTQSGAGPLELLELHQFILPENIFETRDK